MGSDWERMTPLEDPKRIHHGCLCCGGTYKVADPDMLIAVGFGSATVTKNGRAVYDEQEWERQGKDLWTTADAEREARKDPDNDWRIHMTGPLREAYYQRQDEHWVLYDSGPGFA